MLSRFVHHVHKNNLFKAKDKLLLALSGGLDSVVLAHLLKQGDFDFALAHCNFQLRGTESQGDEKFCKQLAESLHAPFFSIHFDAKNYASQHKLSIQMAARHLRYEWFTQLLKTKGYEYLLTAHHANDAVETMLLHLVRGTGLKGLRGIPEHNGRIVRPLLCFTKEELQKFAESEKYTYRTDSSNSDSKYDRNFIRLKVLPLLQKLNPSLENTLIENVHRFNEEYALLHEYLDVKLDELVKINGEQTIISREKLMKSISRATLLHNVLQPFGFNASQEKDILSNIENKGLVGKIFHAKEYELSIDRKEICVRPVSKDHKVYIELHDLGEFLSKAKMHVKRVKTFGKTLKNELFVNKNQLQFPLTLRSVSKGDKFKPFGMTSLKLVSQFLKAEKLNRFQKESCLVLQNGNGEIIWLIGYRSDDRYRIKNNATNILKLICEF